MRIAKSIDLNEEDLPDPLKIVIYRITQEAINNTAKHSKAGTLRILLGKTGDSIELVVEDDGRGFDVAQALSHENQSRGMGLTGMKERAELSNGSFEITSGRGKGTAIRARWPIR